MIATAAHLPLAFLDCRGKVPASSGPRQVAWLADHGKGLLS